MQPAPRSVHVGEGRDGTPVYLVDQPPSALPGVSGRDLAAAWDAARAAALESAWGSSRRFCFRHADGTVTELNLTDRDAGCWVAAVERLTGLHTEYGVSLCLRLLALVDLLARARWTAALCRMRRGGAELHPSLLRAAAAAELTNEARFDETRLRAGLRALPPAAAGAFA